MKTTLRAILLMLMVMPTSLLAQQYMQDAIYLKDGGIYRGMIIETVPNESYRIRSRDGNVYAVRVDEVEKITKEEVENHRSGPHCPWMPPHPLWRNDTMIHVPKDRGYFNEVQILFENLQGGVRMVNGYKFNQYAYLGIGIGIDRVFSSPFNPKINGLKRKALAGIYLPLYLYHSGDGPSRGMFTPFYTVEAGYAMAYKGVWKQDDTNVDAYGNRLKGGMMAGLGLGFKIRPKHRRAHLSILFNINYKQVDYRYEEYFYDLGGQVIATVKHKDVGHLIIPGIRLGFGF